MGAPPKNLHEVDFDVGEAMPSRGRSVVTMAVPVAVVGALLAQTAYIGVRLGSREEKLDGVASSVAEIKTEMYRRTDAEKDREIVNVKLEGLERRVTILEAAREHHVAVVTAKVERQEDDLLTRASHWLTGNRSKP
jgi:hypothetical protein